MLPSGTPTQQSLSVTIVSGWFLIVFECYQIFPSLCNSLLEHRNNLGHEHVHLS